jgi:hypothetical protein
MVQGSRPISPDIVPLPDDCWTLIAESAKTAARGRQARIYRWNICSGPPLALVYVLAEAG